MLLVGLLGLNGAKNLETIRQSVDRVRQGQLCGAKEMNSTYLNF